MGRAPGAPEDTPAAARVPVPATITVPVNLRDVGGMPISTHAQVRRGQLLRSGKLATPEAAATVADLGVRTIYDLRTDPERAKAPDFIPPGCRYVVIDVLGAIPHTASTRLRTIIADPTTIAAVLGEGEADTIIEELYRGFVSFPAARAAYSALFRDLLSAGHRPALVHCNAGRDRTGWAMAALLTLLGVSEADVVRDYLLSNGATGDDGGGVVGPVGGEAARSGSAASESVLLPKLIAGVEEHYLAAAFDEARLRYGTIERYFAEGLGIDAQAQQQLREALTEAV